MLSSIDESYVKKLPTSENEKEWRGEFLFVQGADSQFGMFSSYRDHMPHTEIEWEREKDLARLCVAKINQMQPRPKFFVICGDLTDAMPDDEQMVKTKKEQESDFIQIFSGLKEVPLVCVCGNHDVGNQPTKQTIARYRGVFGADYFSFWAGGVMFLVLNSQYYFDGSLVTDLVKEQEDWLDARLAESRSAASSLGPVIFMHIPPFLWQPEETDSGYFALPMDSRNALLDKLHRAGVRYVFCGHYHRNAGGFYKDMEVIVTSAIGCGLGEDKSGMRLVQVTKSRVSHQYYAFEDFPTTVPLQTDN